MNLKFSVVIPTYNRSDFIGKTIKCFLNQSFKNFELLIIDDGSTDNTNQIIDQFSDSRIKYFKIKNSERGAARNFGLRVSTGDYLNFFDSDDIAENFHLEEAKRIIEEFNYPKVFHLNFKYLENGKPREKFEKITNINKQIFSGNILSCNGVFIRKEIALENKFVEDRRIAGSEDFLLWMRLAAQYEILHSKKITSYIVDHNERSQNQIHLEKIKARKLLMLEYALKDTHIGNVKNKQINSLKASTYLYISLYAALAKKRIESLRFLKKAIKVDFLSVFSKRFFAIFKWNYLP